MTTAAAFAKLPNPPYYAVIFSSQRTHGDAGYAQMADRMVELAAAQHGYLGIESARGEAGFGITVSFWDSQEAIRNWRTHAEHIIAQEYGMKQWYLHYEVRIAYITRAYGKHR